MYFKLQELKIDLQDTPIENIFITDYMPFADGTYVKVYLLGYKYANDKDDRNNFNNETIAKNLKIPLADVLNAWTFWEQQGIVIKHETDDEFNYIVEFVNLKQLYIDKIYKHLPTTSEGEASYMSNKQLIEANKSSEFKQMHEEIDKIFGEPQNLTNKRKIAKWQKQYNLSPEMMVQAFSYCVNNKKIRRYSYIESIISLWHDENITDMDSLSEFLEKREDRFFIYSRISKALGFNNRALTEGERKTIDKWVDDFEFSIEMILKGLDNSTKISNPNINYFDAIFEKWHEKGYKKPEDLINDKKPTVKKITEKPHAVQSIPQQKNKFHNFEQKLTEFSPEELKEIGRRNFQKKLKELGLNIDGEDNK